jgi:5-methylcytosine-specific restriction endonuclease McrA
MNLENVKFVIETSTNMSEVLKKLGLKVSNGNYRTIKKIITDNLINITHFNRKIGYGRKNNKKIPLIDLLVEESNYNSTKLKNRLISEGFKEHKCEKCERYEWLGDIIPIELHHINGNCRDNRLENLQILCRSCHVKKDNKLREYRKVKDNNSNTIFISLTKCAEHYGVAKQTIRNWINNKKNNLEFI